MYDIRPMKPMLGPVFLNIAQRDIKAATAMAVTATAKVVQDELTKELARAIDRPTAYTARAVYRRKRKEGDFFAYEVYLNDEPGKGNAQAKYLAPLIYGGGRKQKRFERALAINTGKSGLYAMPGLGAKLDAYGNMPASQIRQILSYVGAAELTSGYQANTSDKTKRRLAKGSKRKGVRGIGYFVSGGPGSTRNGRKQTLAAGIWQRTYFGKLGTAIKPVLVFTKAPSYKPIIKFYETAQTTINREWPGQFSSAFRAALSSSRRVS